MINTNWQKQAAQVLDEKEVERAFMDQAYNFVANKAGPLMDDHHRLGFEVVYSDEDHTRMVGIFAFRVNRELLYVPAFFLNGQIRGTDLLYTHEKKLFRPLNKDWATYTVSKQKDAMGEGIARRDTRQMPMDIELDDLATPPGSYRYKSASEDQEGIRTMFEKLANSFAESMDSDVKSLIAQYIGKHTTDNKKPEDAKLKEVKDKREEETPTPEQDEVEGGNVKKAGNPFTVDGEYEDADFSTPEAIQQQIYEELIADAYAEENPEEAIAGITPELVAQYAEDPEFVEQLQSKYAKEDEDEKDKDKDKKKGKSNTLKNIGLIGAGALGGAAATAFGGGKYISKKLDGIQTRLGKINTPKSIDKEASFLRKFIVEDGGLPAVEKLASWMQQSKDFAELLVTHVAPEDYMPSELIEQAKSASTGPAPTLVLYTGGLEAFNQIPITDMEKSAASQEEFFSKGYYLWDDRAPGDLNPATKELSVELCKPGEPGVYEILLADGSMKEAILAAPAKQRFSSDGGLYETHPDAWECRQWDEDQPRELTAVIKDTGESGIVRRVHGKFIKTMSDCIRDEDLDTEMSGGKTYRVYDAEAGVLSEPIHCISKKTDNDIIVYTITNCGVKFDVRQNKDVDNTSFSANFLGAHVFFVPVETKNAVKSRYDSYDQADRYTFREKSLPAIGDDRTLTSWILETGVKQASFVRDKQNRDLFSLRAGNRKQTRFKSRPEFAAKMARDLGMHADNVEYFLDKAAVEGEARFFLGAPGIEKFAAPIQVVDEEYFRDDYDPEFNVAMDSPQAFRLSTDTEAPSPPEQHIGDAYDPGMGMTAEDGQSLSSEAIMGAPAEQLEQMRAQAGVPNVFEHGLVGSLIHTYDSVSLVDKYIPDLENALDRLGRLLFLYYWKPRDFEDAYGSDDMANLENQLLSTFQSFGELVLDLLKKSQNSKGAPGNVSMFSA